MARYFRIVHLETWNKAKPQGVSDEQWKDIWVKIKKPQRATSQSSGYDFAAPFGFTLSPGDSIVIPTGIKARMNAKEELKIYPRSGQGFKYFTRIANTVAKIDSDYYNNPDNEGHIFIKLRNEGDIDWEVNAGDRFAQGSFYEYLIVDDDMPISEERKGGLGHSGR